MAVPELELLKGLGLPASNMALLAIIYYLLRMNRGTQEFIKELVFSLKDHTTALVEASTLLKVLVNNAREDRR